MSLLLLSVLAGVALLLSLGVLAAKDNFFASLFMSATLIIVATIYAIFNLQPVFILITLVFVGAIGIVTVALAATYRFAPERQFSKSWTPPIFITALFLSFSIYIYAMRQVLINPQLYDSAMAVQFDLKGFISPEYILLFLFLTSLIILLMLSVLSIFRREA